MSSLFGKLKDFVGIPESDDDYDYVDEYDEIQNDGYSDHQYSYSEDSVDLKETLNNQSEKEQGSQVSNTSNVVGMPGASRLWGSTTEVLVMEPRAFEEMPQVIQALRERKSVVLNLTMMEPGQAQRAVDFVAGATYTIDGHQERVGDSIFLFTPNCVQVSTHMGVVHEAPAPHFSRPPSTAAWKGDMQMNRAMAQ
ncbi:cell division protein SepF [Acaryochloris sp. IP29b_bin.148]|uniref:cell division protein SepF n=1 Tax=Acaryochloris sp. IP29b_bin.148 TaxID=2969218 RepID=UPI00262678F4|nr:cell division protein SepF [Acaryochloris sp. IP29b_bin.148]